MESLHRPNYSTLRRTSTLIRFLAPICGFLLTGAGIALFLPVAPKLLNPGNSLSERVIWGVVGLGYLGGLPLAGYVVFFALKTVAELIELAIQRTMAADKTADLIERQLVPAILRLNKLVENQSPPSKKPPQS